VYPNPVRGRLAIQYSIPFTGVSELGFAIYDLRGRLIWEHDVDVPVAPGHSVMTWDGTGKDGAVAAGSALILIMRASEYGQRTSRTLKKRIIYMP
jgi:hypothetical protein